MKTKNNLEVVKRSRSLHKVLDFYVLREFMVPFGILIIAFILLFLVGDIFNDMSDFMKEKAPLSLMFKYFTLKIPGNIRFVLPISVLLSCMYTMATFGKNMEVTAMRASGISLMRCGGSIFFVGFIVTLINFAFNEGFVPMTEFKAKTVKEQVKEGADYQPKELRMFSYVSNDKKRNWFFKYFDRKGTHFDISLKKNNPDTGRLEWDLHADSAHYEPENGWVFEGVTKTKYSKFGIGWPPEKIAKLVFPPSEIVETPRMIENSVRPAVELPSLEILSLLGTAKNMSQKNRKMYLTLLWNRISFPWACLLAVFLGVPLAAKNERSGVFAAIITAVIVIVLYQVSSQVFVMMGNNGWLPPIVAGLTPSVAFIIYGWYNIKRQV
ncbi:LptF/LptG family permease [Lentisphaerota bacterium WC36G]|nr:LptF/LptG family permease [Lentisphaerae bacterium WC36]